MPTTSSSASGSAAMVPAYPAAILSPQSISASLLRRYMGWTSQWAELLALHAGRRQRRRARRRSAPRTRHRRARPGRAPRTRHGSGDAVPGEEHLLAPGGQSSATTLAGGPPRTPRPAAPRRGPAGSGRGTPHGAWRRTRRRPTGASAAAGTPPGRGSASRRPAPAGSAPSPGRWSPRPQPGEQAGTDADRDGGEVTESTSSSPRRYTIAGATCSA